RAIGNPVHRAVEIDTDFKSGRPDDEQTVFVFALGIDAVTQDLSRLTAKDVVNRLQRHDVTSALRRERLEPYPIHEVMPPVVARPRHLHSIERMPGIGWCLYIASHVIHRPPPAESHLKK